MSAAVLAIATIIRPGGASCPAPATANATGIVSVPLQAATIARWPAITVGAITNPTNSSLLAAMAAESAALATTAVTTMARAHGAGTNIAAAAALERRTGPIAPAMRTRTTNPGGSGT